ncbi:dethiobiotin synthase [Methylobacterium haplocladii]|uniref:ATP-dependent dethiobiotin synthetase BioD n=1 Tax=Methylobacterium haplocladii TaxID=1176176 RepID=A0A512INT3_9HYPH|nr:dethiobiotin synthase [Methylobacterium haplocladii]GEO99367.1 ATP-dependent dethiobiotin synthetase BioD [Methylobacterium haplocladii]GJD83430.1 ATP-dependent dethiobiotin synthetase BioD [Methylobacterium haplocladii]GLS60577.1 ATP-dependent dethiobiotin synthetase BioD [Methylobacterium haplocladii]
MAALRALFIAGAGTEIGKTYVTAALTRRLRDQGRAVTALKPLASGVPAIDDPAFADSDTAILLAAQGLPVTAETVEACSPWRFSAPLAPDQAAAREGRALSLDALVAWCAARLASHPAPEDEGADGKTVLVEGVGGLMSPITADATGLDWLDRLGLPALLVTGSYLGAISHALTAIETLRAHGVPLVGVVVSESASAPTPPETVADAIARRIAAPVAVLHRGAGFPDALAGLI